MQQAYSVVQVTDQLNVGGAEQMIVMLANLLQTHGYSSAVLTTVAPGALSKKLHPAVQQINLRRHWKWNPVTMYRLVQVLRGFDIVHVHSSYNLRYVYLASRLFFLRKPIFYQEHFGDININSKVAWHQRLIYPTVIFIAVSKQLAAWAIDTIKLSPKRVFLLQNTIIKETIQPSNVSSPPYQLLLVSNIRRTKNIEFAVALLKALNTPDAVYQLTIIGQVNDAVYYKELQQLIDAYSLTASVHFIHQCTDIQPLLNSFHLALHTSKSETGPLVLIEYLAQGLPFLTYNTGEVIQQIQPYLPAFIMQDFSIERWVQAVQHLVSLSKYEIAAQLFNLYETHFSPDVYYHRCIAVYDAGMQTG